MISRWGPNTVLCLIVDELSSYQPIPKMKPVVVTAAACLLFALLQPGDQPLMTIYLIIKL